MAHLTEEQKKEATLIASVGCDRELAARYLGCTVQDLVSDALRDEIFAKALRRAEAGAELAHMRNIQQAAKEERHWRASVWWLERRAPHRYGRRGSGEITRRELIRFLSSVTSSVASAIHQTEDRQRVLDKLDELADNLTDPLLLEDRSSTSNLDADQEVGGA